MTSTAEDLSDVRPRRQRVSLALAVGATLPALFLRLGSVSVDHGLEALVFGAAIVGSAFLLSWAAEVAQLDISAGLAIAVLAFIAVLPEYAVDVVFAGKAGHGVAAHGSSCLPPGSTDASPCSLALANMTGSNRLLIGIGWSMVVFVAWWQWRKRGRKIDEVVLERSHSVELGFLAVATVYSLTLPLRHTITIVDAVVLVSIFAAYTWRIARSPAEEPHLVGPARYLGRFSPPRRRAAVVTMLVFSATIIVLCAGRFAEALVGTGAELGISEFLLVQWLAPLASEAPELLVAGLYAYRLNSNAGLGTLVSAKVNQWTLLVGTLPIVFAITSASHHGLPIDPAQREELLLTAAQSVFAVAILANLSISTREAFALFGLFWAQFVLGAVVPGSAHGTERVVVSAVYLLLAAAIFVRDRHRLPHLLRDGFRASHAELRSDA
ncbi:MAG: sodium/calcium exchanger rane region [Acidimicrobiales bacterium]|nr:sodium/calcium exchanger rane region [Acidimicrobiales bacterium]